MEENSRPWMGNKIEEASFEREAFKDCKRIYRIAAYSKLVPKLDLFNDLMDYPSD